MIQFATANGANYENLIAISGHDVRFLMDESSRVDSKTYNRVMENCVTETKDYFFGLHAGEYMNLTAAGIVGQITQTSATVLEGLNYCCEFASLGCRALPMKLEEDSLGFRLNFIPDAMWEKESPLAVKQTIEGTLVFFIREFHLLTVQKYVPLEVGFSFSRPPNTKEYERLFNCPIKFDQAQTYLLFDKKQVDAPIITSDYKLLRTLVQFAEEKLQELSTTQGYFDQVKKHVMNMVKPAFPTIEAVASNMNVSVRTLQRRLKEEGRTYKDVIEALRKELAFGYLKKSHLSIKEVADLLDYADVSAFSRSFKNWTGLTPGQYVGGL